MGAFSKIPYFEEVTFISEHSFISRKVLGIFLFQNTFSLYTSRCYLKIFFIPILYKLFKTQNSSLILSRLYISRKVQIFISENKWLFLFTPSFLRVLFFKIPPKIITLAFYKKLISADILAPQIFILIKKKKKTVFRKLFLT